MYLIDTNIFLEILLSQKQKDICKEFLVSNIEQIYISDFSLHSIGVILFRNNKEAVFNKFFEDIIQKIKILTLSVTGLMKMYQIRPCKNALYV